MSDIISAIRRDARDIVQISRRHEYIVAVNVIEAMLRRIRADGYCDGAQSKISKAITELRTEPLPPMKKMEAV